MPNILLPTGRRRRSPSLPRSGWGVPTRWGGVLGNRVRGKGNPGGVRRRAPLRRLDLRSHKAILTIHSIYLHLDYDIGLFD